MKIESSAISFNSNHQKYSSLQQSVRIKSWTGSQTQNIAKEEKNDSLKQKFSEQISRIIGRNYEISEKIIGKMNEKINDSINFKFDEDPKHALIRYLFEKVFGVKLKLFTDEDFEDLKKVTDFQIKLSGKFSESVNSSSQENWGIEYDRKIVIKESEQMSFSSKGIIKNSDGNEFSFSINMQMSRQFVLENNINIKFGNAQKKDPLVLNYSDNPLQLSSYKHLFDLDSDGNSENISFLNNGSGFLALDRNNDDKINNGSELFGTKTGNGFQELSEFDKDKNDWIDENDDVFNKLQIWNKDINGNDILNSLKSKNIGAIYLKSEQTPFELKNDLNELNGELKSSGVFIKNNGSAGTISQIDLFI
jgi:hypothetical protein